MKLRKGYGWPRSLMKKITRGKHGDYLPEAILGQVPAMGTVLEFDDAIGYALIRADWMDWYWYVVEFDGFDTCWGLVEQGEKNDFDEFRLSALKRLMGPRGERAEVDLGFEPERLVVLGKYWKR